jgi:methyltransferase (TIGR00027 family)
VKAGRASLTAKWVAAARGLGSLLPPDERIADDPFGLAFGGPTATVVATVLRRIGGAAPLLALRAPFMGKSVFYLQVRTRALDDALRSFTRAGGRQVVILGAGFDCRAERFSAELDGARVFEIDHPATQARKRAILDRAGADQSRVVYLPWDFEHQSVDDLPSALAAAGHDRARPTLTIWEGVTMYLTEPAIEATVAAVRAFSTPGSPFAISYFEKKRIERPPMDAAVLFALVRRFGEPFKFGWDPPALPSWLAARGFRLRSDRAEVQLAAELLPARWRSRVAAAGRHIAITERI